MATKGLILNGKAWAGSDASKGNCSAGIVCATDCFSPSRLSRRTDPGAGFVLAAGGGGAFRTTCGERGDGAVRPGGASFLAAGGVLPSGGVGGASDSESDVGDGGLGLLPSFPSRRLIVFRLLFFSAFFWGKGKREEG